MPTSSGKRGWFLELGAIDLGILVTLGLMAASAEALDLFHVVFLLLVVEAFLITGRQFWPRVILCLAATEFLLIRAGSPAWQDQAEPCVLATIATLVFLMHASREKAHSIVRDQATHDPLTGLLNRRALQTHLDVAVSRLRRDNTPFAVVYIDLDGFKAINDTHGHDVGDELLTAAAKRIEAVTRGIDVAGRIGGDEFALLLGTAATPADAESVAQRLIEELDAPFSAEGVAIKISASMGIAMAAPESHQTSRELLSEADRAMYDVKRDSRGTYGFAAKAS